MILILIGCVALHAMSSVASPIAAMKCAFTNSSDAFINEMALRKNQSQWIVYNRIPKVGSTAVLETFRLLERKHVVRFVHSQVFDATGPTPPLDTACAIFEEAFQSSLDSLKSLKNNVRDASYQERRSSESPKVVVYDKHFRHVDFGLAGLPPPSYINVFREPVARSVSWYYYQVQGPRNPVLMRAERARRGWQVNLTVDECLRLPVAQRLCGFQDDQNVMTALLCGSAPPCDCVGPGSRVCSSQDRQRALHQALAHLDAYAVVGLHSHLPQFLMLLRCRLPALAAVPPSAFRATRARVTAGGYPPPSAWAVAELQLLAGLDQVLYERAQVRFAADAVACGLNPNYPPSVLHAPRQQGPGQVRQ